MSYNISHTGVVKHITDSCVKVEIIQTSACAACKVASHCNAAESKIKLVDVFTPDASRYQVGQQVTVWASKSVANRALLLGFGLPFLLLVCVLMIALRVFADEGLAALLALASLVPYYLSLWLMRDRIQRHISFQLEV